MAQGKGRGSNPVRNKKISEQHTKEGRKILCGQWRGEFQAENLQPHSPEGYREQQDGQGSPSGLDKTLTPRKRSAVRKFILNPKRGGASG